MGIFKPISSCGHLEPVAGCWDCGAAARVMGVVGAAVPAATSAPNPGRFIIERLEDHGEWSLALVRYPDATNYEGRKILVYRRPASAVRSARVLDPHFCDESGCVSPFARFEPTDDGWLAAYLMIKGMKQCWLKR